MEDIDPELGEKSFDIWLKKGLKTIWGGIAEEPLTPEMVKILEKYDINHNKKKF